jgi:hypothetical protein
VTPRYIIEIKVREVDAQGVVRDTYGEYATTLAIVDQEAADLIAFSVAGEANLRFKERTDSSPVAGEEVTDPTYLGSTTWKGWKVDLHTEDGE